MTDNEFVDKYQNALSDLCGVDYAYMQGNPAVDTIVELIRLAVEQKAEIERLQKECEITRAYIHNNGLEWGLVSHLELCKNQRAEAIKKFAKLLQQEIHSARTSNFNAIRERQIKHKVNCFEDTFCCTCHGKITALDGIDYFIDNLVKEMENET